MILLKELKLNNFLSHENTEINFKENEKVILDGKSGSGKSSIVDSILFAMYGQGRSDNKSLIRRGAKNASVSLKLTDGSIETIITRSVSDKGKNTLNITQNTGPKNQFLPIQRTGLKDHDDWIQNVFLRSSYELFTNSIAYPQESENSFVKSSASRRKDLLLEIIHAGDFDVLYEKTRELLTKNQINSATSLSKIDTLENSIKSWELTASKYDFYNKKEKESEFLINEKVVLEKELEAKISNINELVNQISDKKKMRDMFLKSLNKIKEQQEKDLKSIEEFKKIDINRALADVQEITTLTSKIEGIEKKLKENADIQMRINSILVNKPHINDYTKEIEDINKRLIPLIKDSGSCPAGDECPFVIPIKGQIEFLTEKINEKTEKSAKEKRDYEEWEKEYMSLFPVNDTSLLYTELTTLKNRIEILSESKRMVDRYEILEKANQEIVERIPKIEEEKKQTQEEIESNEKIIKEMEEQFTNLNSNAINLDLSSIRIKIQELRKNKEEATLWVSMAINAKKEIETASTSLVELKKGILKAKEDQESLELLKEALSPRGIKVVIIDYLIPQLEDRINDILSQMSDFRIRLDTQQSKAKEEDGNKEGLFIIIRNGQGEEMPYENFSGGEKIKITIAIAEALASLLANTIGFRIMDENIVSLDSESTQNFVDILLKLQEKFPQLIIISHLQDIRDLFEQRITVTKVNGISKIA